MIEYYWEKDKNAYRVMVEVDLERRYVCSCNSKYGAEQVAEILNEDRIPGAKETPASYRNINIEDMVDEIVSLICASHTQPDEFYDYRHDCLHCSHWNNITGGCRAKEDIRKTIAKGVEEND